jgi:ankyrin repeat protein
MSTKNFTRASVFEILILLFVLTLGSSCGESKPRSISTDSYFNNAHPPSDEDSYGSYSDSVEDIDDSGSTPLHYACELHHLKVVDKHSKIVDMVDQARQLIKKGANINLANKAGYTPLYIVCENGGLKIAQLLVDNGAMINSIDNEGHTPLYVACKNGHLTIVKLLIEKGATINQQDVDIARQKDHQAIVSLLSEDQKQQTTIAPDNNNFKWGGY